MAEPLLRVSDLVAGYGGPVIGPLSFLIFPGEVVGLWGSNGSGKSTLLRVIAEGTCILAGHLERQPHLTVAWQHQQPVRLDEMPFNGHDYLRFARADRGQPLARLEPLLEQRIDRLSGGQFQLLAVWAILGSRADLILLDEPTNNLDPEGEDLLSGILRAEQGQRAVLLVSHEQDFLRRSCNRVLEVTG